ncbi:hypothetical protein ACLMJK_005778 [Lecanora helva]
MGYKIELYVDGGCRRNGYPDAIGAGACVHQKRGGRSMTWTRRLPYTPQPTSQRAEITAIILALETAWDCYRELDSNPYIYVTIYTDSKYAYGCMREWNDKWLSNNFTTSAGHEVVNRDLIEEAYDLEEKVAREGQVDFKWIPRSDNQDADGAVNQELDEMDEE